MLMHLSSYSLNFLTKTKKLLTGQYSDLICFMQGINWALLTPFSGRRSCKIAFWVLQNKEHFKNGTRESSEYKLNVLSLQSTKIWRDLCLPTPQHRQAESLSTNPGVNFEYSQVQHHPLKNGTATNSFKAFYNFSDPKSDNIF